MAELLERWPAAVGAAIAQNAWPARISKDGTVHIATNDSVWAFELGQRAGEIAAALCGAQGAVRSRAAPAARSGAAGSAAVEVTPEEAELARAIASSIEDEKLRESVQKAVSFSLARGRSTT